MGLTKTNNTDAIDFMDSTRKLIVTAPRGSGKTAILFSFIHDVRNYYDIIWWFDCNDSFQSTLLSLAHEFHVSSIERSENDLGRAVLEALFSSLAVNSILLIIDNVQKDDEQNAFEMTANIASNTNGTTYPKQRPFRCHDFLRIINETLDGESRRQRRCHIIALYTDHSANQQPSKEISPPKIQEEKDDWLYLPLEMIVHEQTPDKIIGLVLKNLSPDVAENRKQLIRKILSIDSRRLTMRLTNLLLTSTNIDDTELTELTDKIDKQKLGQNGNYDVLSQLIKLALEQLKKEDERFFLCAEVASLIHTSSISREVFRHIYRILCPYENTSPDWDSFWQQLLSKYKKYCLLKQNFLVPTIHRRVSERHIPSEYVEVYSIPSTYAKALCESILRDNTSRIWEYAFELINNRFSYDYYGFKDDKNLHYDEQGIFHYLDHAIALIKRSEKYIDNEHYAQSCGELLCRLGSYYLNERRMYSEAAQSYFKANTIFDSMMKSPNVDGDEEKRSLLFVLKCSTTQMWKICEHLTGKPDKTRDEDFISKIEETRLDLGKISVNAALSGKYDPKRYQVEATIAVARINVQIARNSDVSEDDRNRLLTQAKKELENIQNEDYIGTRTRSLLFQVLGTTYSLLKRYKQAIDTYHKVLKMREEILSFDHLDVARAKYRLALCLVDYITNSKDETCSPAEYDEKLNEAKCLCEKAFTVQQARLPAKHSNLEDCSTLRKRIAELFEKLKDKQNE
ncbi:hypothetical protein I4U23_004586 [Adineta vaga]|nr:hypothetical protein I4U23_004586 [Adineta vaga]